MENGSEEGPLYLSIVHKFMVDENRELRMLSVPVGSHGNIFFLLLLDSISVDNIVVISNISSGYL